MKKEEEIKMKKKDEMVMNEEQKIPSKSCRKELVFFTAP